MTVNLTPYLQFRGQAREAMEFYADLLGGELSLNTFAEFGMGEGGAGDQVMHSQVEVSGTAVLMGSDVPPGMETRDNAVVSLFGGPEDEATMRAQWDRLADGGTVSEPLVAAPWGDVFGQLTDRFGIFWMVNIGAAAPQG